MCRTRSSAVGLRTGRRLQLTFGALRALPSPTPVQVAALVRGGHVGRVEHCPKGVKGAVSAPFSRLGGGGGSSVRPLWGGQTVCMGPTWGPKPKKNENGIFGISESRGSEKWSFPPVLITEIAKCFCQKMATIKAPDRRAPFPPPHPPRGRGDYTTRPPPLPWGNVPPASSGDESSGDLVSDRFSTNASDRLLEFGWETDYRTDVSETRKRKGRRVIKTNSDAAQRHAVDLKPERWWGLTAHC